MSHYHDRNYKRLFQHKGFVEELLRFFVNEGFTQELDYSTLELVNKSFITEAYKEKESDIIYKINFKNSSVYIYLLMEFQSTVDKTMSLRILRYICEFYEHLINSQGFAEKLPAVFPVLIYNGDPKWTSVTNIRELIHHSIPENYIPSFEYYKIIENEFSEDTLMKIKNALAAVFLIENSDSEEKLKRHIKNIITLIEDENPEVISGFKEWVNSIFENNSSEIITNIENLWEVKNMLSSTLERHDQKIREESVQQGMQQGIQQGMQQGVQLKTEKAIGKMLQKGFKTEEIADLLETTVEEVMRIKKNQ